MCPDALTSAFLQVAEYAATNAKELALAVCYQFSAGRKPETENPFAQRKKSAILHPQPRVPTHSHRHVSEKNSEILFEQGSDSSFEEVA